MSNNIATQNPYFTAHEYAKMATSDSHLKEAQQNYLMNHQGVDPTVIDVTPEEFEEIKSISSKQRYIIIALTTMMIITAWINFANLSISKIFLALYLFVLSMTLCCAELAFLTIITSKVASNFGFLYTGFGKMLFVFFLGLVCFQLSLLGKILFGFTLAYGFMSIYYHYKHPKLGKYQKIMHLFRTARPGRPSQGIPSVGQSTFNQV